VSGPPSPADALGVDLPGFLGVDHVAIAVPPGRLAGQVRAYAALGFHEVHREVMGPPDQVTEVLLRIGTSDQLLQLLEPLGPDSPVQKALDRNGGRGGLNHVGFRVRDVHAAHAHLRAQGFNLVDAAPRRGSRGTTVFFVHPRTLPDAALDVLIEVVQV